MTIKYTRNTNEAVSYFVNINEEAVNVANTNYIHCHRFKKHLQSTLRQGTAATQVGLNTAATHRPAEAASPSRRCRF